MASCFGRTVLLGVSVLMCASITANTAPLRIVAIGASNTHGWYVGNQGAYPAQLQALLQASGIDAQVTNTGVPFDTTWMMLRRIDTDVPNGTDIVIVQPTKLARQSHSQRHDARLATRLFASRAVQRPVSFDFRGRSKRDLASG